MHRILTAIIVAALGASVSQAGQVTGHSYMERQINHSGITVTYQNMVLPGLTASTTTNSDGSWTFPLVPLGLYNFFFSHSQFVAETLKSVSVPPVIPRQLPDVVLETVQDTTHLCVSDSLNWVRNNFGEGAYVFPGDEGKHMTWLRNPVEWWSAYIFLNGVSPPYHQYGACVAFFKTARSRVFAITNVSSNGGLIVSTVRHGTLDADRRWLDVTFGHFSGKPQVIGPVIVPDSLGPVRRSPQQTAGEIERTTGPGYEIGNTPDSLAIRNDPNATLVNSDYWRAKGSILEPLMFQYLFHACDNADGVPMALDLDMYSLKAPLLVSGDGLVTVGSLDAHFYSETRVDVGGTIRLDTRTEPVTGFAWINHQWGNFTSLIPPTWELFSIQLDDSREISVGDVWTGDEPQGSYCGGLNLYNQNCELEVLHNYVIRRDSLCTSCVRPFAYSWTIIERSKPCSLTVHGDVQNQSVPVSPEWFFPAEIEEASCTVTGTIAGSPVHGKAYVEATKSWGSLPPIDPTKSPEFSGRTESMKARDLEPAPGHFDLLPNSPNPFNPVTEIRYHLVRTEQVSLRVYDILGRKVAELSNGVEPAGEHAVRFDGTSHASGVYIYALSTPSGTLSRKMLLMK